MPKYVLDDKGILTIISENDGGIFTINDILKKITKVLFILSIASSVGLYTFFYYDVQTTNTAIEYSASHISDYEQLDELKEIAQKSDLGYGLKNVFSKAETSPEYYWQVLQTMTARGQDLLSDMGDQIDSFRQSWR